jgi:hypothetical protein
MGVALDARHVEAAAAGVTTQTQADRYPARAKRSKSQQSALASHSRTRADFPPIRIQAYSSPVPQSAIEAWHIRSCAIGDQDNTNIPKHLGKGTSSPKGRASGIASWRRQSCPALPLRDHHSVCHAEIKQAPPRNALYAGRLQPVTTKHGAARPGVQPPPHRPNSGTGWRRLVKVFPFP